MITSIEQLNDISLSREINHICQRIKITKLEEAILFPKFFQIETTRICNAKCTFCPVDIWDKSIPFMSEKLFDKIVDEMSDYTDWIEFVAVQRAGEPLVDKNIASRIRKLKDIRIKHVSMSTNASLLNERRAREILDAGLDELMISIDSVDKETYEKTRVGLRYEKVMGNIRNFFKIREEICPEMLVRVRGVSLYNLSVEEDRKELNRWEDFWGEFKKDQDRIYMKRAHTWGNQIDIDGYEKESIYHPCILPWSTMHITSMGIVPLCPQDYDATLNIGDINEDSIADVWKNENWSRIRMLHQTGRRNEITLSQGCKLFDLEHSLESWQNKQLYDS